MRRVHPLWRGFWLACMWTAALVLLGGVDWLAAYRGGRTALALVLGVAAGAFLASIPALVRRREDRSRPHWARLVICFLAGAAMALACGMAGTGRILPALMEGSVGAYAFLGMAALTGFVTARIMGRRAEG